MGGEVERPLHWPGKVRRADDETTSSVPRARAPGDEFVAWPSRPCPSWNMGGTPMLRESFPRIVLALRRLLLLQIIQQVHEIRVVQLEPLRDRGRRHAATLRQRVDDLGAKL